MKKIKTVKYNEKIAQLGNLPPGVNESHPNFYSPDVYENEITVDINRKGKTYYIGVKYSVEHGSNSTVINNIGSLVDNNGNVVDEDPQLDNNEMESINIAIDIDAIEKGLISSGDDFDIMH